MFFMTPSFSGLVPSLVTSGLVSILRAGDACVLNHTRLEPHPAET